MQNVSKHLKIKHYTSFKMKAKLTGFLIITFLVISCTNDKSIQIDSLKNQVLTELFLIKAEDFDNGKLEVNKDVIKEVDTLIGSIQRINNIQKSELIILNSKLKTIIQSANIADSLKANIIKNFQGIENEININSVLINIQTATFFLKKKYHDNLYSFDLLKPLVQQFDTDSGKVIEVQLMVASSRTRPNIYLGNPDTIHVNDWYRYKMNNFKGDHFKERLLLKEDDIREGLYQIHTSKGNLLIRFNTHEK